MNPNEDYLLAIDPRLAECRVREVKRRANLLRLKQDISSLSFLNADDFAVVTHTEY
jgi:hypothetical protein